MILFLLKLRLSLARLPERGASSAEYALLLAGVSLALVSVLFFLETPFRELVGRLPLGPEPPPVPE